MTPKCTESLTYPKLKEADGYIFITADKEDHAPAKYGFVPQFDEGTLWQAEANGGVVWKIIKTSEEL